MDEAVNYGRRGGAGEVRVGVANPRLYPPFFTRHVSVRMLSILRNLSVRAWILNCHAFFKNGGLEVGRGTCIRNYTRQERKGRIGSG